MSGQIEEPRRVKRRAPGVNRSRTTAGSGLREDSAKSRALLFEGCVSEEERIPWCVSDTFGAFWVIGSFQALSDVISQSHARGRQR